MGNFLGVISVGQDCWQTGKIDTQLSNLDNWHCFRERDTLDQFYGQTGISPAGEVGYVRFAGHPLDPCQGKIIFAAGVEELNNLQEGQGVAGRFNQRVPGTLIVNEYK